MAEPECICEFPAECDGSGIVQCEGCGGDQCVCACCFGNGETTCEGCDECRHDDEDDADHED
jgi:hypothetical protein